MTDRPASLQIGPHRIGPGEPILIVAEIGINHNGSVDRAKHMIELAHEAGASAVKFQKRDLSSIYTGDVLSNLEHFEQSFQYLIPILRDFELEADQLAEVEAHCRGVGIQFLCTPFDRPSLALLEALDVPGYKVASGDLTNLDLLEALCETGKPLMLSTGMSLAAEVDRTVEFLRGRAARFALLHCVSSYPVDPRDANLRRIHELEQRYGCPVGYSGHDLGTSLSVVAASLGACIIEKHFTLDRAMRGPDHKISLLPEEIHRLVASVRECEQAMRSPRDHILQGELLNQMVFRKSVVAAKPIRKGERLEREMLTVKGPGTGLSPQQLFDLIGRSAPRDMIVDEAFRPDDLEPASAAEWAEGIGWGRFGLVVRYHDFEHALRHDPDCLEFHLTYHDTLLEIPHEKLELHAARLRQMTLRVHCCEYIGENLFDLCSKYPDILDRSLRTLQRVIDVTDELASYFDGSTPGIVFNCGAMSLRTDVRDTRIDVEGFHERIGGLDLRGTHLLAQNMPPYPWYFGGQWKGHYFLAARELIDFCQATGQALCLDLSHAHMACTYLGVPFGEYLEQLRPHVQHVHLSDAQGISGEGTQVGTGDVDFELFFRLYGDYVGTWVPEIWQGHVNDNAGARLALARLAEIRAAMGRDAASRP